LRKLKSDPETADLPVVVVTSKKLAPGDSDPAAQLADGYIYKGDLSRELLQSVLAVIVRNGEDS
jgi:CheY-like chemotaxis protein